MRSLSALREMLPGSFVERRRKCGKPNCRCAQGEPEHLHLQFLLSVLFQGKPQTFHIPAELVEEVRSRVELHKRFQQAANTIDQPAPPVATPATETKAGERVGTHKLGPTPTGSLAR